MANPTRDDPTRHLRMLLRRGSKARVWLVQVALRGRHVVSKRLPPCVEAGASGFYAMRRAQSRTLEPVGAAAGTKSAITRAFYRQVEFSHGTAGDFCVECHVQCAELRAFQSARVAFFAIKAAYSAETDAFGAAGECPGPF